jgi:uncharacterized protein YecT (DUF1311 family)
MKTIPVLALGFLLLAAVTRAAGPAVPIVPEGWVKASDLNDLQEMLQKQLDTGVDMVGTAWKMATVRDVQLFAVYIAVYEKLPEAGREALRKEQAAWLKKRAKTVASVDDGKNGQVGRVEAASQFQDLTEKRTSELQRRLAEAGVGK